MIPCMKCRRTGQCTVKFLNLPKIQGKRPNLCVFLRKEANGIANSEDPDQTAPLGAV